MNIIYYFLLLILIYGYSFALDDKEFNSAVSNGALKQDILNKLGNPDYITKGPCKTIAFYYKSKTGMFEVSFDSSGHQTGNGWSMGHYKPPEYYPPDSTFKAKNAKDAFESINLYYKSFILKPIEKCDSTIRIFYLPSFNPEMLIEIHFTSKNPYFKCYIPSKSTFWYDMWEFNIDKNMDTLGGRLKTDKHYNPSIQLKECNISNIININNLLDSLFLLGIDTIKSVSQRTMDGINIYIEMNNNYKLNWFSFDVSCYYDNKYNWISQKINNIYKYIFPNYKE
jgi:hypothetical protein